MNCISWTDAFLIFKRWRDNQSLVLFGLMGLAGDTLATRGETARVELVDPASGSISSTNGDTFDLLGATFEYRDERDSPFEETVTGFAEFIEATLPDGRVYTLAAFRD